jgi:hypothetical protein
MPAGRGTSMRLRRKPLLRRYRKPDRSASAGSDSTQRRAFESWLASYRKQLEKICEQREPGDTESEERKEGV